ncbi:MAG: hypothetical protein AB2L24_19990 [Mangrovibacterium sp.]
MQRQAQLHTSDDIKHVENGLRIELVWFKIQGIIHFNYDGFQSGQMSGL